MGKECSLGNLKRTPLCSLHSNEQPDSGLTPCVRMSWEKEISVPGRTEAFAVVTGATGRTEERESVLKKKITLN